MFPTSGKRRNPHLFSVFLSTKAKVKTNRPSLGFAIDLAVQVPEYTIDGFLWRDQHYAGSYHYRDTITVEATPTAAASGKQTYTIRYGLASKTPNRATKPRGLTETDGKHVGAIPIESNTRPGLSGRLLLTARPWRDGQICPIPTLVKAAPPKQPIERDGRSMAVDWSIPMRGRTSLALLLIGVAGLGGCKHPEVTAVPLSPWNCSEKEGIPFYLPKPLLIVSKNFRHIEEPKVGLTDSAPIPGWFDDQAKYADVNARTNFGAGTPAAAPAAIGASEHFAASGPRLHSAGAPVTPFEAPSDGLSPETFFTYQIIFVPDLTQKYGLKVRGGAGEIRAAMNLVNGWQYTGMGPFYLKDSSTAQNVLASGITANLAASGVADVVESVAGLAGQLQAAPGPIEADHPKVVRVTESLQALDYNLQPLILPNFAEIHVFEPHLTIDGRMEWVEIVCLNFDRTALGAKQTAHEFGPAICPPPAAAGPPPQGALQTGIPPDVASAAVAAAFGLPAGTPALIPARVAPPPGNLNQVQVNCGEDDCDKDCRFPKFDWRPWHHHAEDRPTIVRRTAIGIGPFLGGTGAPSAPESAGGFGLQSGIPGSAAVPSPNPVINNQIINHPARTDGASEPAPAEPALGPQ